MPRSYIGIMAGCLLAQRGSIPLRGANLREKIMSDEKTFGYKVDISSYCTESEYSDEPYGDWYTNTSNSFESISITDKYPDVASVEEFKTGDEVYVVWAEWSSGDSFGHGDRCSTEALAVFSKSEDAYGFAAECEKSNSKEGYSFTASTGQKFNSGYVPWSGYFESLDGIHVAHSYMN